MKTVKINDFDWDGFRRSEFCIVSDSSQNLLAVLQALSAKGYYWGISGKSLIEDSITTDQLLDDIKQESIYIRAGGVLENGVLREYSCKGYEVVINFEEDKNMKEIKRVKAKDFDWEAFRRKEFRIVIRTYKNASRTLRFLHEKGYVWGNSKTSLLEDDHIGKRLLEETRCYPVFIIAGGTVRNGVLCDSISSYIIPTVELVFEEETKNDKIVITNDGKTTTATLYSNGKKVGIGTAVCHDDDVFDIYAGAKLALERLEKNKKETKMTNWEKFIKGEVDMRVPKKYIENFLNRAVKDSLTFKGMMSDWYIRWLEQDGDSIVVSVDCDIENIPIMVEVIHGDWGRTVDYIPGMK